MTDRLTMNGAADRLISANDALKEVLETWYTTPDEDRRDKIQQVQWDLANAITPAANWRIMAEIDDVIIVRVKRMVEFLRRLGNGGK